MKYEEGNKENKRQKIEVELLMHRKKQDSKVVLISRIWE
jgi:hypothetical protein